MTFHSPSFTIRRVRVAALVGPRANDRHLEPFRLPGINLFKGNELDPGDDPDAVLIFGGDGTVHRQLRALANSKIPTLVVPTGSGNDFAHSIGIQSFKDAVNVWRQFAAMRTDSRHLRDIDLGTITELRARLDPAPEQPELKPINPRSQMMGQTIMQSNLHHVTDRMAHHHYFCCIAGAGLDADANRRANAMPSWLRSRGGYVIAALKALAAFEAPQITVSTWEESAWETRGSGKSLLCAFANAPAYGDGMKMAPGAQLDDGLLNVCYVRNIPKLRVLRFLHTIFTGAHVELEPVTYFQTNSLVLESDPPLDVYADGEYICSTPVEAGIAPRALRVIVPG
jgi:diacylglycerol kinase (ATP)